MPEARFYPAWFYAETIFLSPPFLSPQGTELLGVTELGWGFLTGCCAPTLLHCDGRKALQEEVENYLQVIWFLCEWFSPSSLHCRSFLWTRIPAACSQFCLLSLLQFLLSLDLIELSFNWHQFRARRTAFCELRSEKLKALTSAFLSSPFTPDM